MNWSFFNTSAITDEVVDVLLLVLPVAVGLFAIYFALKYAKKIFTSIGGGCEMSEKKEPWESYDIWTEKFDKEQMDKFYDNRIKPHI